MGDAGLNSASAAENLGDCYRVLGNTELAATQKCHGAVAAAMRVRGSEEAG